MLKTFGGTKGFQAPEMLDLEDEGDSKTCAYTFAVDVWCIGEIIFRALTGTKAFRSNKVLRQYGKGEVRFPSQALLEHSTSNEGCEFVERLMAPVPEGRLTAEEALTHGWVKEGEPDLYEDPVPEQASVMEGSLQYVHVSVTDDKADDRRSSVTSSLSEHQHRDSLSTHLEGTATWSSERQFPRNVSGSLEKESPTPTWKTVIRWYLKMTQKLI